MASRHCYSSQMWSPQQPQSGQSLVYRTFWGSGKSTLAHAVEEQLHQLGCRTFVFDGDNVRHGLCSDLGFSPSDRSENIRRIGEMVNLFLQAGIISLTAFISPLVIDRTKVRNIIGSSRFIEIYSNCPLEVWSTRRERILQKSKSRIDKKLHRNIFTLRATPSSWSVHGQRHGPSCHMCWTNQQSFLQEKKIIPG